MEGSCQALLRSLRDNEWVGDACGLDLYGKPLGKTAEKIVPAFVAWHVGVNIGGKIPPWDRTRVSRILNKHLLDPCGRPALPEGHWSPEDTVWRDVEALRLRFERLRGAGAMQPLPPMAL